MNIEPATVEARFRWASPRLREFAQGNISFDSARTCDRMTFERLLSDASLPRWPWIFDFEARFGGMHLHKMNLRLGLFSGLSPKGDRPHQLLCSAGMKTRRGGAGEMSTRDDSHSVGRSEEWLVFVGDQDRDAGLYGGEAGKLFWVRPPFSPPLLWAGGAERFFERLALDQELTTLRRAAKADLWLEVEREVGAALALKFSLPEIAEASDDVARFWWDGELCVCETISLVEPAMRATRLECADLDRLLEVGRCAYRLANKGRKRPLHPRVPPTTPERKLRVIGYAPESYEFARRVSALRRVGSERVTAW